MASKYFDTNSSRKLYKKNEKLILYVQTRNILLILLKYVVLTEIY